jgi:hypothetical protein
MPFDYGLRLNNRQCIANATETQIEANKNQSPSSAPSLAEQFTVLADLRSLTISFSRLRTKHATEALP